MKIRLINITKIIFCKIIKLFIVGPFDIIQLYKSKEINVLFLINFILI